MGRSLLILLDTHVVLWIGLNPERISKSAKAALDEARRDDIGIAISAMTLLEIARLSSRGQIQLHPNVEDFIAEVAQRFTVVPMSGRICIRAYDLPTSYPNDPVDRVIGATALVEGLTLITADAAIRKSRAVPTLW
jgi:PIN domain nuclease of toxin-antitoxin system